MARQVIDTTTDHGSYKGDPAKVAFDKANANFDELYSLISLGGDNLLINCGVPINQRGFAGGALAAGAYGYDRWKAGTGGCNVTINATTGIFTHTSGPLQQIVEAPQLAWGLPLTISVENPSGSVSVSVGGATGTITAGTGRRGVTLTPSGSGNLTVQLTASGVTYVRPKLERGNAPTPYVPRPHALEVALCQRYYQKSYNLATTPGTVTNEGRVTWGSGNLTNSLNRAYVTFKCPMRAPPAVVLRGAPSGTPGFISQADGSNVVASPEAIGETGFNAAWSNTNGQWGGWWHWTADSEI